MLSFFEEKKWNNKKWCPAAQTKWRRACTIRRLNFFPYATDYFSYLKKRKQKKLHFFIRFIYLTSWSPSVLWPLPHTFITYCMKHKFYVPVKITEHQQKNRRKSGLIICCCVCCCGCCRCYHIVIDNCSFSRDILSH